MRKGGRNKLSRQHAFAVIQLTLLFHPFEQIFCSPHSHALPNILQVSKSIKNGYSQICVWGEKVPQAANEIRQVGIVNNVWQRSDDLGTKWKSSAWEKVTREGVQSLSFFFLSQSSMTLSNLSLSPSFFLSFRFTSLRTLALEISTISKRCCRSS